MRKYMASIIEQGLKETIIGYLRRGEKIKLCITDLFLRKGKLYESEVKELLSAYYLVKLFNTSQVYNELKNESLLVRDSSGKEQLTQTETVRKIYDELGTIIAPYLAREVWGRGDIIKTLDERYSYLIQKILARGGTIAEETLLADIGRDLVIRKVPSYYTSTEFEDTIRNVEYTIGELNKAGYVTMTPLGYHIPDFVVNDFLGDTVKAMEILSSISVDLWMAFNFQYYISIVYKLDSKYEKISKLILDSMDHLKRGRYNDALDSINASCDELTNIIYFAIFGEDKEPPRSLHARLIEIWKEQSLHKDNPELIEAGRNAAIFLSSTIYIAKWIRDKVSHPLIMPSPDAVRLAFVSLLLAIDVSRTLKII